AASSACRRARSTASRWCPAMLEYQLDRRLTGGVRLPANKERSTDKPIRRDFAPREVVLRLLQHRASAPIAIVTVGRRVHAGEMVARPGEAPSAAVHASITGRVRAIEERLVPTGDGLKSSPCIVIERTDDAGPSAAREP